MHSESPITLSVKERRKRGEIDGREREGEWEREREKRRKERVKEGRL